MDVHKKLFHWHGNFPRQKRSQPVESLLHTFRYHFQGNDGNIWCSQKTTPIEYFALII